MTSNCLLIIIMLTISTWNVRGIMSSTQKLIELLPDTDIFVITEHWLCTKNLTYLDKLHDDFKVVALPTEEIGQYYRGSGGVAVFYRSSLCKVSTLQNEFPNIMAVKILVRDLEPIILIATYFPSTTRTDDTYDTFCENVFDVYDRYSAENICIIIGDMNADIVCKNPSRRDLVLKHRIEQRNIVATLMIKPHEHYITYRSKDMSRTSTLDYILIPEIIRGAVKRHIVNDKIDFLISDHLPITAALAKDILKENKKTCISPRKKWDLADPLEKSMYKSDVSAFLNFTYECKKVEDIERYNELITKSVITASDRYIPKSEFKSHLKPYWKKSGLEKLHQNMRKARGEWINAGKNRSTECNIKKRYKDLKRKFRKKHRLEKKVYKECIFEEIEKSAELGIDEFYAVIRENRKDKSDIGNIAFQGIESNTLDECVNLWKLYFSELSGTTEEKHNDCVKIKKMYEESKLETDNIKCNNITEEEVLQHIKSLKTKKSPGIDCISNEHLKYGGKYLIRHLSALFNYMIQYEYLPNVYRCGMIIPIYKQNGKDKKDPVNYRGITLTSCLGKLFEKILMTRIQKYLDKISFPHPYQFGFRKKAGAISAAYTLQESLMYYNNHNSNVYAAFLDNEKAFDRLWHCGLLTKLKILGINAKVWRIIAHSYTQSSACVAYRGCISNTFPLRRGVGQGRVMSAFLFLVYINDLLNELVMTNGGITVNDMNIPGMLLADDTTLLSSTLNGLQMLVNTAYQYAQNWKLKYNSNKSNWMIFSKKKEVYSSNGITLGSQHIPRAKKVKYAGVTFSQSMKNNDRIVYSFDKAKRVTNSLYSIGLNANGMNPIVSVKVWERVILPSALYGSELWFNMSHQGLESMEKIQRYFARRVQGFPQRSPIGSTISCMGMISMEARIDKQKLVFLGRMCRTSANLTAKKVFLWAVGNWIFDPQHNYNSFLYDINNVLKKYDLDNYLKDFIFTGKFPDRITWKNLIGTRIQIFEERKHEMSIRNPSEGFDRFLKINPGLKMHHLWKIAYTDSIRKMEYGTLIRIGGMQARPGLCPLCGKMSHDRILHISMNCSLTSDDRNHLMESLFSHMPPVIYRDFCDQIDDVILIMLLGGLNDITERLEFEAWINMIRQSTKYFIKIKDTIYSIQ